MAEQDRKLGESETEGIHNAPGRGAGSSEAEGPKPEQGGELPEHRSMGQRTDLGEGDIEASEYEDQMSRQPSRT